MSWKKVNFRFRATSECVPEGPLTPLVKSPASSKGKIPRLDLKLSLYIFAKYRFLSKTFLTSMHFIFFWLSGRILNIWNGPRVKTSKNIKFVADLCSSHLSPDFFYVCHHKSCPGTNPPPTSPKTKEISAQHSPQCPGIFWPYLAIMAIWPMCD